MTKGKSGFRNRTARASTRVPDKRPKASKVRKNPPQRKNKRGKSKELSSTMQMSAPPDISQTGNQQESMLVVACPECSPRTLHLRTSEVIIGRDDDCTICLPTANVSRKHARVRIDRDDYVLEDLDSTNGTYVNGASVTRRTLRSNDLIMIGDARLQFVQMAVRGSI